MTCICKCTTLATSSFRNHMKSIEHFITFVFSIHLLIQKSWEGKKMISNEFLVLLNAVHRFISAFFDFSALIKIENDMKLFNDISCDRFVSMPSPFVWSEQTKREKKRAWNSWWSYIFNELTVFFICLLCIHLKRVRCVCWLCLSFSLVFV